MSEKRIRQRIIRIHRRDDGRFVCRNDIETDSPLGVDRSLSQAIGTAQREATLASSREGCRVVIEIEQEDGKWKRSDVINPPKRR